MAKWRSKRNFESVKSLSSEELAMEDIHSPEVHVSLSDILADVESGKMYVDYPGGIEQLKIDVERERCGQL